MTRRDVTVLALALSVPMILAAVPGGVSSSSPAPTTLPPTGAAGGDLSGTFPNPSVQKATGAPLRHSGGTALELYLDPTGSDSNACTAAGASACLTPQGVADKIPVILDSVDSASTTPGTGTTHVVVHVAAGSYGSAGTNVLTLKGRTLRSKSSQLAVWWEGPAQAVVAGPYKTGGGYTMTGSTTDPDLGTSDGNRSVTVSPSPAWAADAFLGLLVTDGASVRTIVSNTADTIEFAGSDSNLYNGAASLSVTSTATTFAGLTTVAANGGRVLFYDIAFTNSASPLEVQGGSSGTSGFLTLQRCRVLTTSTGAFTSNWLGPLALVLSSVIGSVSGTPRMAISNGGSGQPQSWTQSLLYGATTYTVSHSNNFSGALSTIRGTSGTMTIRSSEISTIWRKLKDSGTLMLNSASGSGVSSIGIYSTGGTATKLDVTDQSRLTMTGATIRAFAGTQAFTVQKQSQVHVTGPMTLHGSDASSLPFVIDAAGGIFADGSWTGTGLGAVNPAIQVGGSAFFRYGGAQPTMVTAAGAVKVDGVTYAYADLPLVHGDTGSSFVSGTGARVRWRTGYAPSVNSTVATGAVALTSASAFGQVCGAGGAYTLPPCSVVNGGLMFSVKFRGASGSCSVTRDGSDTIDGAASVSLTVQYASFLLQCDGAGVWDLR